VFFANKNKIFILIYQMIPVKELNGHRQQFSSSSLLLTSACSWLHMCRNRPSHTCYPSQKARCWFGGN